MHNRLELRGHTAAFRDIRERGNPVKETLAALDSALIPRCGGSIVAHKHDICSESVRTVLLDNIVRVNDISS